MKTESLPVVLSALIFVSGPGCGGSGVSVSATEEGVHQDLIKEDDEGREILTSRPKVVELPRAAYPSESPQPGLEGMIMVRVLVGTDGQAVQGEVAQGLHPDLDKAALAAALAGVYRPGLQREIPAEGWLLVPFRYPPE